MWALATKGWEPDTLRTPSEVAANSAGPGPVVSVSGPALAAKLAVGAQTGGTCAARGGAAAACIAGLLTNGTTRAITTSDVAGIETAAAFKNVVAVAVGVAEGLAGRLGQTPVVSSSATPPHLRRPDCSTCARLVAACGGRPATVLGIGGAGDLFLTCSTGRNGRFGRLLGAGVTIEHALRGRWAAPWSAALRRGTALALAERHGIDLPVRADRRQRPAARRRGRGRVERLRGDVFMEALSTVRRQDTLARVGVTSR